MRVSWGQTAANRSWRRFCTSRFIFKGQLSILLRFLECAGSVYIYKYMHTIDVEIVSAPCLSRAQFAYGNA